MIMNKNYLTISVSVLLLIVAVTVGCGDPKVTGKVMFPDGTPLTTGVVMFQKENFIASGNIQKDGTYSAGKLKDGDGLPPGQYQVFINGASTYDTAELERLTNEAASSDKPVFQTPRPTDLVDTKYMSPQSSGLTVEVNGRTKFDITVEPPQP